MKLPFLDNGVAQICILVKDLDKTVENYWNVFGIGPWHFYTYKKPMVKDMSYYGKSADYEMRIALSYLGDSVYSDYIEQHGYGVQHLGLLVDNMQEAIEKAENKGFKIIQDGSGFGLDGDGHYAYLDTEEEFGITFELIERPKGRLKPEKIYPPE